MKMLCSNTYEELRNDVKSMKPGDAIKPNFDYDRLIEIVERQFFKGDTRASEGICADNYSQEDYKNIASLLGVIHKEPGSLLIDKVENLSPVQRAAYAKVGMIFINNLVDAMLEGAMQQMEREV